MNIRFFATDGLLRSTAREQRTRSGFYNVKLLHFIPAFGVKADRLGAFTDE
jgi:hypothetical protein